MKQSYLNKLMIDYIDSLDIRVSSLMLTCYSIIAFTAFGVVMMMSETYSGYFEDEDPSAYIVSLAVVYAAWLCWITFGILSAIMSVYLAIAKNESFGNKIQDAILGATVFFWLGYAGAHIIFNFRRKRRMASFINQIKKGSTI